MIEIEAIEVGREGFEEFFERERDSLFRVLVLATNDRSDAEELVQEAPERDRSGPNWPDRGLPSRRSRTLRVEPGLSSRSGAARVGGHRYGRRMRILRTEGGLPLLVPVTRRERMRGLRGREPTTMLFERARSVHTFGMEARIVVAILDRGYRVLSVKTVPPRRIVWSPRGRHILEAPVGISLRPGDRVVPPREGIRPAVRGAEPRR
jgi:hypothetical protein